MQRRALRPGHLRLRLRLHYGRHRPGQISGDARESVCCLRGCAVCGSESGVFLIIIVLYLIFFYGDFFAVFMFPFFHLSSLFLSVSAPVFLFVVVSIPLSLFLLCAFSLLLFVSILSFYLSMSLSLMYQSVYVGLDFSSPLYLYILFLSIDFGEIYLLMNLSV